MEFGNRGQSPRKPNSINTDYEKYEWFKQLLKCETSTCCFWQSPFAWIFFAEPSQASTMASSTDSDGFKNNITDGILLQDSIGPSRTSNDYASSPATEARYYEMDEMEFFYVTYCHVNCKMSHLGSKLTNKGRTCRFIHKSTYQQRNC